MLKIIAGPMFAGKTTSLINQLKALELGTYLVFKPSIDVRYDKNAYVSHDGLRFDAQVIDVNNPDFSQYVKPHIKTLVIDELNFFEFEKIWPHIKFLLDRGMTVIGAGLLYDFKKQPFGATLPLTKYAYEIVTLRARCDQCQQPAEHSYRKVAAGKQFLLGASESYGACCDQCWESLQSSSSATSSMISSKVQTAQKIKVKDK